MDFGDALRAAKDGARIARSGWNGKGMWVALSPGFDGLPAAKIWSAPIRDHANHHGHTADFRPYLMMKTAQDDFVPWVISQSDALADDWERV
jgi:hypothetical protein